MEIEINKEIFAEIGKDFNAFLQNEENERIIFSGKYGSGKTTFLKCFFEDPTSIGVREINYKYFRISPINYSISGNEDIIELIKYDLIIEFLMDKTIEIKTSDIQSYQFISEKDIQTIFRTLLSVISFKGIKIEKLLEGLKELKKDLEKRKSDNDEGDTFANFLDKIENRTGLFERDLITKMIENVFSRIKESNKKIVLVIDDLDRVDPDHIFRILNVFSAHFDDEIFHKRGQKNKFGFDKIIAVCDYNNIQSLFHCKYGEEADFGGYIDKFYSRSIFQFNIKEKIELYFRELLYKMDHNVVRHYSSNFNRFGREELFEKSIIYSILYGILSIRTLNKLIAVDIQANDPMKSIYFVRALRDQDIYTLFLLKLNVYLLGGIENLIRSFDLLAKYNFKFNIDKFLVELIYKVESHHGELGNENIEIKILKDTFVFEFEQVDREKVASKISIKDSKNVVLNNSQSLDILKHFLNRIKQLTGVA